MVSGMLSASTRASAATTNMAARDAIASRPGKRRLTPMSWATAPADASSSESTVDITADRVAAVAMPARMTGR